MPEIAKDWHPTKNGDLDPSHITCYSHRKVWWMCPNNHSYESTINNRVRGNGCPFCSGNKTLEGFNDLKTWCLTNNRQDLLNEWDYSKNTISPSSISPKNNNKFWWKCSLGHEWDATLGSRTTIRVGRKPSGCPYCSNPPKRILFGFNDLETWCKNNDREQVLREWDYEKNILTPQTVSFIIVHLSTLIILH